MPSKVSASPMLTMSAAIFSISPEWRRSSLNPAVGTGAGNTFAVCYCLFLASCQGVRQQVISWSRNVSLAPILLCCI